MRTSASESMLSFNLEREFSLLLTHPSYGSEKDIVTPAQSVLLKLLVSVYRPPVQAPGTPHLGSPNQHSILSIHPFNIPSPSITASPSNSAASSIGESTEPYEVPPTIEGSIPTFFVGVFRKQVLPPTIKIIQLQGAIRKGKEKKEKFEYSLWDLDRIYEGVYQFLELLVLFSEDEEAKKVLLAGDKGLVADLVQFLGELDRAIPRWVASKAPPPPPPAPAPTKDEDDLASRVGKAYMVERPFDVEVTREEEGENIIHELDDDEEEDDDGRDDERGLAEPEDFTWPHIKRYLVLLLSGFAWKNKAVQDIVREKGGLQVILNQCMIDDDNPCESSSPLLAPTLLLFANIYRHPGTRNIMYPECFGREPNEPEDCGGTRCGADSPQRSSGQEWIRAFY